MRELRLLVFFVVGLALGGGAVSAFAAAGSYGRSMNLNYPNSGQARPPGWYSQPRYDFPGAPDGWGHLRDINELEIGGRRVTLEGVRKFAPGTLARLGVGLARSLGPLGIGLTLADLVWDEAQGWLIPGEEGGQPAPTTGGYTLVGPYSFGNNVIGDCRVALAETLMALVGSWGATQAELTTRLQALAPASFTCSSGVGTINLEGVSFTTLDNVRFLYRYASYLQEVRIKWSGTEVCESGQRLTASGRCVNPTRPAQDTELEDAIYTELVARGMGSDLARRLIEAGYKPEPDEVTGTGPDSVPGDTITSTTSGPAGQTTTTTNTTHNIAYNTNTTNNTTTVTITNTTTTTTTAPDGTTTTETTTESPADDGGTTPPPEEPKPFCELYPTASACAELGETPDEELEEQSVDVSWEQQGGAAGACPAPIQISVLGTQHAIQWTPICNVASGIRPIVIGLAWLSAALWLFLMARARA